MLDLVEWIITLKLFKTSNYSLSSVTFFSSFSIALSCFSFFLVFLTFCFLHNFFGKVDRFFPDLKPEYSEFFHYLYRKKKFLKIKLSYQKFWLFFGLKLNSINFKFNFQIKFNDKCLFLQLAMTWYPQLFDFNSTSCRHSWQRGVRNLLKLSPKVFMKLWSTDWGPLRGVNTMNNIR